MGYGFIPSTNSNAKLLAKNTMNIMSSAGSGAGNIMKKGTMQIIGGGVKGLSMVGSGASAARDKSIDTAKKGLSLLGDGAKGTANLLGSSVKGTANLIGSGAKVFKNAGSSLLSIGRKKEKSKDESESDNPHPFSSN